MNRQKMLLLGGLCLGAFVWVSLMAALSAVSGNIQEGAATNQGRPFTDDGSIKAEITSLKRDQFKISMTVKVTDDAGKVLEGRSKGDIEIFEAGESTAVTHFVSAGQAPIRLCILIDYSNSMKGARITNAKKAALALLDMLRDDIDHLGLFLFPGATPKNSYREALTMDVMTPERRIQARDMIQNSPLGLGTPMFNTMKAAFAKLGEEGGRRVMVVLGDGADTDFRLGKKGVKSVSSSDDILEELAQTSEKLEIPIHIVSLEGKSGGAVLKRIADKVRGNFSDAENPEDLEGIFKQIGADLQNEYVIEYDSPNPIEDGTTRNVVLTVRHGDKGTTVSGTYRVPGVTATGAAKRHTNSGEPVSSPPFWSILITMGLLLGGLFAVPYWRK